MRPDRAAHRPHVRSPPGLGVPSKRVKTTCVWLYVTPRMHFVLPNPQATAIEAIHWMPRSAYSSPGAKVANQEA